MEVHQALQMRMAQLEQITHHQNQLLIKQQLDILHQCKEVEKMQKQLQEKEMNQGKRAAPPSDLSPWRKTWQQKGQHGKDQEHGKEHGKEANQDQPGDNTQGQPMPGGGPREEQGERQGEGQEGGQGQAAGGDPMPPQQGGQEQGIPKEVQAVPDEQILGDMLNEIENEDKKEGKDKKKGDANEKDKEKEKEKEASEDVVKEKEKEAGTEEEEKPFEEAVGPQVAGGHQQEDLSGGPDAV